MLVSSSAFIFLQARSSIMGVWTFDVLLSAFNCGVVIGGHNFALCICIYDRLCLSPWATAPKPATK